MKRLLISLFAVLLSAPVFAQTVANGPYYAEPAWDQTLPPAQRFIVLSNMGNAAVLDRETGLVWERDPVAGHPVFVADDFGIATRVCPTVRIGNRLGWRLPSFHELASLVDASVTSGVALPAGHPFLNIAAVDYWSSTAATGGSDSAYAVTFSAPGGVGPSLTTNSHRIWCVRGGGPLSIY
jgi:Protein of unknown function (DUF1566)